MSDEARAQLLGDDANARTTAHRALGDLHPCIDVSKVTSTQHDEPLGSAYIIRVLATSATASVTEHLLLLRHCECASIVEILQGCLKLYHQGWTYSLLCQ